MKEVHKKVLFPVMEKGLPDKMKRKNFLTEFLSLIFRFFLPQECPLCGKMPSDGTGNMFCKECLEKFHFVKNPVCPGCGGELTGILELCTDCLHAPGKRKWKKASALFVMEGTVKEVVYKYKYRKCTFLAAPLGNMAAEKLAAGSFQPDIISYTPLHWTRYLLRGYNQAELLAMEIGRNTHIPVARLLKRTKFTRQQARLKRGERIRNMHKAFKAVDPEKIRGKRILLIDDVLTTGATLSSATEELLKAGAAEVNIFVLAVRHSDSR